jgi:hypothetical protein
MTSITKRLIYSLLTAIFVIAGTCAHAQSIPFTANSEVKTQIVYRGTLVKIADLHFGNILPGTTAGVVILAPDGNRTSTGGVTLVDDVHHPAQFSGYTTDRRSGNRPIRLAVGSNTIQLTGPGAPMTVRNFSASSDPARFLRANFRNFRINGAQNGLFDLFVGARLLVNANQTPGFYTGTWTITADFP